MTTFDLGLLPSGHLHCFPLDADDATGKATHITPTGKAFGRSVGEGLFTLAARKNSTDLSPSLQYWRNFACNYLSVRCLLAQENPQQPDPVEPFTATETMPLLLSVPPMRGAEYLSASVLQDLRTLLDNWVCEQIQMVGGLDTLLAKRAPWWHQVGRVCFHLAENKNDPDYPFAFMATYAPELSEQGRIRHQPLGRALQEYAGAKNRKALIRLLSPVQLAAETSPVIKDLVDSGDIYHPLAWSPGEAYEFLKDAPGYEQCGVVVRLPDWWKKRSRPRASVTIGERKKRNFNADSLLDFKLHIALGSEPLSKAELKKLMAAGDGLVFMKGQWVEVNREKLDEVLAHWKRVEAEAADGGLTFAQGMRLLAGAPADLKDDAPEESREWSFVQPGKWLASELEALRSPDQMKAIHPGRALKATLRPYQQEGVNWLWLLSQLGLGACLADDMGLGKTMQVISLLLALKKRRSNKPSLLVLPASLIGNWKTELDSFAPSLRCLFIHSSQLNKKAMEAIAEDRAALQNTDLVLTTYGTLMRQEWLQQREWRLLVLDEAQAIKNPAARQSKAVKNLNAKSRIALTGTPVENRLSDLWSMFDFLNPGLLGSAGRFKGFVKSLSERKTDQYAPLRNLVSPYILRRLKTDRSIISDLPEKTEVPAYCGLSRAQAAQYQRAVKQMAKAIENLDGIKRRGLVLSYLLRFKQICNHPSQLSGDGEYDPKKSGKFQRLAELCEEISSRQEKLLVFTQFREMTTPLANFLAQQFGQPGLVLHGGTAVKQRQKLVERFQGEDGPPFFIKKGMKIEPIEVQGRKIVRTFWGEAWCNHLEKFSDYANRLPRGRTYVRNGSVCHLAISKGKVAAIVSGSALYKININITPLSASKWKNVRKQCTGQIGSMLELLQGRLSDNVMEIVTDQNKGLFPKPSEIKFACDCPDWAGMCKHIAAVLYGVGARLDHQPELLFLLRNVDHEELISAELDMQTATAGKGKRRRLAGADLSGVFGVEMEEPVKPGHKKRVASRKATTKKSRKTVKKRRIKKTIAVKKKAFTPTAAAVTRLRKRFKMNASQFAMLVGVSSPTVGNWESGSGKLNLRQRSRDALIKAAELTPEQALRKIKRIR